MDEDRTTQDGVRRTAEGCEHFGAELSAWLDGELRGERETELLAHLETCEACRRKRERYKALDEQLRSLEAPTVSARLSEGIWARIRDEAATGTVRKDSNEGEVISLARVRARRLRRAAWFTGLAAAAAGLALFITQWEAGKPGPLDQTRVTSQVSRVLQEETPNDEGLLLTIENDEIEDLEFLEALDVLEEMARREGADKANGRGRSS